MHKTVMLALGAILAAGVAGCKKPEPGAKDAKAPVQVSRFVLAAGVENREPVKPMATFEKGTKVYAWAKLRVSVPETTVAFKWYVGDKLSHAGDPIPVKSSPGWRMWAYKTVDAPGAWRVQLLDAAGRPLHTESFVVE